MPTPTKSASQVLLANVDEASGQSYPEQLRDALAANSVKVIDLFREWDEDESGTVSKKEFRKAMPMLGLQIPIAEMDKLFDSWDSDRSGQLGLGELTKLIRRGAAAQQLPPKPQGGTMKPSAKKAPPKTGVFAIDIDEDSDLSLAEQLRKVIENSKVRVADIFAHFDEDKSGTITKKEFRQAMPMIGANFKRAEMDQIFDSMDTDSSGTIHYKELNQLLRTADKRTRLQKKESSAAAAAAPAQEAPVVEEVAEAAAYVYIVRKWSVPRKRRHVHRLRSSLASSVHEMWDDSPDTNIFKWHDSAVLNAAEDFDRRHRAIAGKAEGLLEGLQRDPTSRSTTLRFKSRLLELRCNHYRVQPLRFSRMTLQEAGSSGQALYKDDVSGFVLGSMNIAGDGSGPWAKRPMASNNTKGYVKPKTKRAWNLEKDSVWVARMKVCDSKSLFENPHGLQCMLEKDFGSALSISGDRLRHKLEALAGGDPEGPAKVRNVIGRYIHELYALFDFYAATGSSSGSADALFAIHEGAFQQFCRAADIVIEKDDPRCVRKECPLGLQSLAILFAEVNKSGATAKDNYNHVNMLKRWEWLWCIVALSIRFYLCTTPGEPNTTTKPFDVPKALETLIERALERVPAEAKHISEAYRIDFCYTETLDKVLWHHKSTLEALFYFYAKGDDGDNLHDALQRSDLLSFDQWTQMGTDLRWVDEQCSRWDMSLVFVRSRMYVYDESSSADRARFVSLDLSEFMEAIIRLADFKLMPFLSEAQAMDPPFPDVSAALFDMGKHEQDYSAFLQKRLQHPVPQAPLEVQVDDFIQLILRTVCEGEIEPFDPVPYEKQLTAADIKTHKRRALALAASREDPEKAGRPSTRQSNAQVPKRSKSLRTCASAAGSMDSSLHGAPAAAPAAAPDAAPAAAADAVQTDPPEEGEGATPDSPPA